MARPKSNLIAALDVGTSKVCCFIARIDERGRPRIIGIGHQVSRGIKSGTVVNMELAENCIRNVVHSAEKMSGEQIQSVYLNLSGGHLRSQTVEVEVNIAGHEVGEHDIKRVLDNPRVKQIPPGQELIHGFPVGYSIDQTRGIRDPRGMYGESLCADIHLVTADSSVVKNLITCVNRAHLDAPTLIAAPYASGLACLTEDELDLGVTLVDMGGGTTSISVFFDGYLIYCDSIPVGGHHITNDIARGLSTPLSHAERMKTLYGNAFSSAMADHEIIDVPQIGEDSMDAANHIPKSMLSNIIRPRIEETLELVRSHLQDSGVAKLAGRRCVLTGGASQLPGVPELATAILDKQTRCGRPSRVAGLAEATEGPAFSTCAGLLLFAAEDYLVATPNRLTTQTGSHGKGLLGRAVRWMKENF